MKLKLLFTALIFAILPSTQLQAQTKGLSNFYGNRQTGEDLCIRSGNYTNDVSVERLIAQIEEKFGMKNRFLIIPCDRTPNAQATIDQNGRPYILYNPEFLKSVKSLNFTTTSIPSNMTNWETLTILAHEIAHHLNYHLVNPHPDATFRSMEIEADETAGFILYKLGATLEEAQRAMRSASVSIEGSYTHPPRAQRLEAIRKGWEKARGANPAPAPSPTPAPTPAANKITDIDGNQYDLIKIGNQIWMKENLKVSKYRNGESIPTGLVNSAWANTNKGAYAIYNNENANNNIYGKLYNWYAVNDSRGLCPTGWHVPRDSEWSTLISYLGGESVAGGKLKSTGIYYWNSPNSNATNVSGFSALPGGYLSGDGNFNYRLRDAVFWSANEKFTFNAWYFYLHYYNGNMGSSSNVKQNGYSVRCLKD